MDIGLFIRKSRENIKESSIRSNEFRYKSKRLREILIRTIYL